MRRYSDMPKNLMGRDAPDKSH